jgi:stage V sporulation protein R
MLPAQRHRSPLSAELAHWAERIEAVARSYGLSFHPVEFELLDARAVNGLAAYGGFPVRYPSWRFGMEFERLEKGYHWGLSKIYELVINNDPVVAYLVRSNSLPEQKLVMAHVFGHADFFRNNCWFASTERRMLDAMAQHATLVRRRIDSHGLDTVERFLDLALSLENLIDPYLPLRRKLASGAQVSGAPAPAAGDGPTFDVLGFLCERAPLEEWQREILALVRDEAYYFQPQRMTKIMNEGWASYWHSRILTGGVLDGSEIVDFADCHSGATATAPGRLNPYKLGIELFRCAERRGEDLMRLRRVHDDASFVDELLDEEFVASQKMFLYARNPRSGKSEVAERDAAKVKARLLADLSWGGLPRIELAGVDEGGALHLVHHHDGRDLQLAKARETLARVAGVWGGPALLDTREDGAGRRLRWRAGELKVEDLDTPAAQPTN